MNKPTDICFKCEKVDELNTMQYVDQESKHDDRLICDDCNDNNIYRIYIECSGGLHTLITEHDYDTFHNSDYFLRKTIDSFGSQWGRYPEKCKYKLEEDKKWKEVEVNNYVFLQGDKK